MQGERELVGLRSKLEALNYRGHVDASSAPLVSKLVDDLIYSRQEYVASKQTGGRHDASARNDDDRVSFRPNTVGCLHGHGMAACSDKGMAACMAWVIANSDKKPAKHSLPVPAAAITMHLQALQMENSQLHIRLIQEAEAHDRQLKQQYQDVKRLEGRIAELSFWKQTAQDKLAASERGNYALQLQLDDLVRLNDRLASGTVDPQAVAARIAVTMPPSESGPAHRWNAEATGQGMCAEHMDTM